MVRTMRTVRYIVLRKGGKHLTIVTYGQLGPYSKMKTVPTSHVSNKRCLPNLLSRLNILLGNMVIYPNEHFQNLNSHLELLFVKKSPFFNNRLMHKIFQVSTLQRPNDERIFLQVGIFNRNFCT